MINNTWNVSYIPPFSRFYWLNIRRNSWHYFIYAGFCAPATMICTFVVALKGSLFQVIILYGSKLFDLVSKRIETMANLIDEEERRKELREIVQLHQLALEYLSYLESTMNLILISQMMGCLFVLCLVLFYVTSNFGVDAINIWIMLLVLLIEMTIYCFIGTDLSEKAAEVGHAMYRYPWYKDPVDMQKSVQLIIQRAQRPAGITAAKFYFVNVQRLVLTIRATFSYFLVLKDVF
ncbi:odorant receptor 4-like [Malaya genurostris]|uniref:odorant receptor 4-like n=1 Tax=Malaya genurostris TaxID=325434 RepID=UPI0026F3F980|nr:odorant receptor 4-like [Malaya genurostris]